MSTPFTPPPNLTANGQTSSENCTGTKYTVTSIELLTPPGCSQPPPQAPYGLPWSWQAPSRNAPTFGSTWGQDAKDTLGEFGRDVTFEVDGLIGDIGDTTRAITDGFSQTGDAIMNGEWRDAAQGLKGAGKGISRLDQAVRDGFNPAIENLSEKWIDNPISTGLKNLDGTVGTRSTWDSRIFVGADGNYDLDFRLGMDYELFRLSYKLLELDLVKICSVFEGNLFTDVRYRLSKDKLLDQGLDVNAGGSVFGGLEATWLGDFSTPLGELPGGTISLKLGGEIYTDIMEGTESRVVYGVDINI
tara:strand:+ start:668 stop:1573 length:906 start_codon:yes stop_codon:yes gene_type:complete